MKRMSSERTEAVQIRLVYFHYYSYYYTYYSALRLRSRLSCRRSNCRINVSEHLSRSSLAKRCRHFSFVLRFDFGLCLIIFSLLTTVPSGSGHKWSSPSAAAISLRYRGIYFWYRSAIRNAVDVVRLGDCRTAPNLCFVVKDDASVVFSSDRKEESFQQRNVSATTTAAVKAVTAWKCGQLSNHRANAASLCHWHKHQPQKDQHCQHTSSHCGNNSNILRIRKKQ